MAMQAPTLTVAPCPVCEAGVETPGEPLVGELLTCTDCGVEIEIVAVDPISLAEAPEIEEDWGE